MDWDSLNHILAPFFQGSIKNPDEQVAFSQISFCEAETWHHCSFDVKNEIESFAQDAAISS